MRVCFLVMLEHSCVVFWQFEVRTLHFFLRTFKKAACLAAAPAREQIHLPAAAFLPVIQGGKTWRRFFPAAERSHLLFIAEGALPTAILTPGLVLERNPGQS